MLQTRARISAERSTGWNRQLRITPLTTRDYFRTKVLTGYAAACATIAVMYVAGATLGVSLSARNWVEMTLLILVGLVPFAAGAIAMGHLVPVDSIGPAMGLLFCGGAVVCAPDSGAMPRREAMTIPTANETAAIKSA